MRARHREACEYNKIGPRYLISSPEAVYRPPTLMLIKRDQNSIKSYFEDSSNLKGGHADSVVIPENINDLSEFVKKANIDKLPITVSGGGTCTTGSRIPFGGVVISLEKFNKIIDISKETMCAVAQAGVKLQIGFIHPFDESFLEAKEILDSGEPGRIMTIKSTGRGPGGP